MEAIINGMLFGLTLSIMIGPVFFMLLQASLEKGFKYGVFIALGINVSDIAYILLVHWGAGTLLSADEMKPYMGPIGGLVLVAFGVASLFKQSNRGPSATTEMTHDHSHGNIFKYFLKGFFVNTLSPFVPIFWIAAVAMATGKYGLGTWQNIAFFVVVLFTLLVADMTKAFLAGKLRKLITEKLLKRVNIAVGLILIAFGIRLFFYEF